MANEMIYKATIDQAFFENGETFTLENSGIQITIKGNGELAEESPAAYYYDDPYYMLEIKLKDLKKERLFSDFKNQVEKYLISFKHWLNDIKALKISTPVFSKGYINNNLVNREGQRILGSGSKNIYKLPPEKEVTKDEIKKVFDEIDETNGELEYLNHSRELFEKRRDIFLSKNNMGNYVGLYAFLQGVINSNQREVDNYIKSHSLYDSQTDRQTTKKDRNYNETIYSWLRNQVGHVDLDNTDFRELNDEINEWYEKLYEITLSALEDKENVI